MILAGVAFPESLALLRLPKDGLTAGGAAALCAKVSFVHLAGQDIFAGILSIWSFPNAAHLSLMPGRGDIPPDSTLARLGLRDAGGDFGCGPSITKGMSSSGASKDGLRRCSPC